MSKFLNVEISAEDKAQTDKILNALLERKLVTGGQFIKAPARFWWQDKIVDMDYLTVTSFTVLKHKTAIVELASQMSEETVPLIRFSEFEGSPSCLNGLKKLWHEPT